jgi:hypothetical protein
MKSAKYYLACFWGVAAFFSLWYGITYRSIHALLLFAVLAPLLIIYILWMIDRAVLERRIKRLEARSEIADERRVVARADLDEVEHKLEQVETRVACAESINAHVENQGARII